MADDMSDIVEILESELEKAFEVKNPESLHRYVVMMVERFASKAIADRQDARFDEVLTSVREGFERMDLRFEDTQRQMDQRFEAMQTQMDQRFEAVHERFEAMDKRFEAVQTQMAERFEAVDKRFDDVNKRFTMVVSLMSVFFTLLAGMITAFGVFGCPASA
jgi:DNA anti-recombination protein RmuC